MKLIYKSCLAAVLLFLSNSILAGDISISIKAEQWDIPRHGEAIIKYEGLRRLVNSWREQPGSKIELRYPGGEEGELWVGELMDWLIALGIPSSAMSQVPGSGAEDIINLVLIASP